MKYLKTLTTTTLSTALVTALLFGQTAMAGEGAGLYQDGIAEHSHEIVSKVGRKDLSSNEEGGLDTSHRHNYSLQADDVAELNEELFPNPEQ